MLLTASNTLSKQLIHRTSDDRFVWVVNRDNNSVSVIKVEGDVNKKIAEIPVGKEPRCVAITPDDKKVFVTNMVDGTVSVIDAEEAAKPWCRAKTIRVGTEPFGCAVTPDAHGVALWPAVALQGRDDRLVVACLRQGPVTMAKHGTRENSQPQKGD
jgi:YVTN family beta-propeller protein